MKPVIRRQSQLLYRRSYKPGRFIRVRPAEGMTIMFRPTRNGLLPKKSAYASN